MTTASTTGIPDAIGKDRRILVEEMACVIADAQAALFAGRYEDLAACIVRMRELCEGLKLSQNTDRPDPSSHSERQRLIAAAEHTYNANKVFAAALHRIHRNFEAFRNVLHGPSLTYQPQGPALPERKS